MAVTYTIEEMRTSSSEVITGYRSGFNVGVTVRATKTSNVPNSYPYIFVIGTFTTPNKTFTAKSENIAAPVSSMRFTESLRFNFDENILSLVKKNITVSTTVKIRVCGTTGDGTGHVLVTDRIQSPKLKLSSSDTFTIINEDGTENVVDLHPVINTEGLFSCVAVDDILPGKPADMLVNGYSKASITFDTGKIETKLGATVAKIDLKCEGDIYSTEDFTQPVVTSVLGSGADGNVPVIITVTDNRGFSTEAEGSLFAYGYSRPVLTDMIAYRSDKDKNENDEGTYLTVQASERHTALEGYNSCVITAEWGAGGQTGVPVGLTSGTATTIGGGTIQPTSSYVVRFTARDDVGNTNVVSLVVPTPSVTFDALNGGNGFAFGKMAERDGVLESVWDISSHGSIEAGVEQREEDGKFIPKAYMDKDGNIYGKKVEVSGTVAGSSASFSDDVYANVGDFTTAVASDLGEFNRINLTTSLDGSEAAGRFKQLTVSDRMVSNAEIEANGGIAGVTNYPAAGVEELTGGTWVNANNVRVPIYRQVLVYNLNTTGSTQNGPTIADFGEMISMTGSFYRPSDGFYHQLNFYASSSDMNYAYMRSDGVLRVRSTDKAVVTAIVEYIKK